jgi:pyridoxal phosphate enzyme (YggS family)
MDYIKENIESVRERIAEAAQKSGRNANDITLIAVTKNFDVSCVDAAIDCGVMDMGENRVQEMLTKIDTAKAAVNWHMIGHLQTNKVKYIVDRVKMIHSVESVKLLTEIDSQAKKHGIVTDILFEVNISGEESKFGIDPSVTYEMAELAQTLTNIRVRGLMTVAPYTENPEENRVYFAGIRKLFEEIRSQQGGNIDMQYLSMGMSGDFEEAILEGSNMVRVGSAIFGKRDYSKKY